MTSPRTVAVMLSLLPAIPAAGAAQQPMAIREEKPGLLAQAKITPDSARRVALSRVPSGTIESAEIEMENKHLIYSFDMSVAGKPGITEVQVDARTGKVLGVEHEDAAAEARERKADSANARP